MTDTDVRNALLARVETTYLEWLVMPPLYPMEGAAKREAYRRARAALREHDAQAEGAPPAQPHHE